MKLNKNQLSVVVKSIIKEEIEKFKSLKEGSWQVITNDEGEPIGKDYVYGPEDPEYYETGDDYGDDRPRSRVGSSTGQKSDVINSIRDTLKRNDIYSKIVMSSGRSGRYISIPYGNSNLTINFVFKRGQGMKIEVGSRLFDDAYEAVDYLLKNSDKNMFKSQSEHESSLKAGAKDRRAQNVKDKEAKKAEQEKLEKLEKIKRIPAIASAIGEHGLYNKRDFKVLFGNTPSKVISATIQDILETMPYDELRKIVKITVDKPKYFSENKKTTKKQITISELRQIIRENIESLDDENSKPNIDFYISNALAVNPIHSQEIIYKIEKGKNRIYSSSIQHFVDSFSFTVSGGDDYEYILIIECSIYESDGDYVSSYKMYFHDESMVSPDWDDEINKSMKKYLNSDCLYFEKYSKNWEIDAPTSLDITNELSSDNKKKIFSFFNKLYDYGVESIKEMDDDDGNMSDSEFHSWANPRM